jgi:hypothetical protein
MPSVSSAARAEPLAGVIAKNVTTFGRPCWSR